MRKKQFKCIIFILLIALMAIMTACTNEQGATQNTGKKSPVADITVFSDTHLLSSLQYGETVTSGFRAKLDRNEKAIGLTEAIYNTAIDDFIASDSPILIITGDLTDDGAKVAHEEIARGLKRAEDAGKRCYVINGNHDINNRATSYVEEEKRDIENVSPELFAEIYADFGYSEALTRDPNTLSYTAELNDKYRLIAWDIAKYDLVPGTDREVEKRPDPYVTTEKLNWLTEQLDQCYLDGKTPFLITHFPILSHIGPLAGSMSYVNRQDEVLEALYYCEKSVPFSFCGHVHQQDIATYTYPDNTNYYEIETGSLSYSNLPKRRFIDDGENISVTTMQQSYVKAEYLPSFYTEAERNVILADLPAYVWEYQNSNFSEYMYGKLYFDDICAIFGKTDDESIELLQSVVDEFYYMPLYEKDADGGKSLEGICKKYGVTDFPTITDGKNVGQFLATLIKFNFAGNENMQPDSPEAKMLRYAFYAAVDQLSERQLFQKFGFLPVKTDGSDIENISALFRTGKLEIVKSNILGIVSEIPAVKNNSIAKRFELNDGDSAKLAEKLAVVLENADVLLELVPEGTIGDLVNDIYDEERGFSDIIDMTELEETGAGYINIGGILDILFTKVGVGLLWDEGAPDHNFTFTLPYEQEIEE